MSLRDTFLYTPCRGFAVHKNIFFFWSSDGIQKYYIFLEPTGWVKINTSWDVGFVIPKNATIGSGVDQNKKIAIFLTHCIGQKMLILHET